MIVWSRTHVLIFVPLALLDNLLEFRNQFPIAVQLGIFPMPDIVFTIVPDYPAITVRPVFQPLAFEYCLGVAHDEPVEAFGFAVLSNLAFVDVTFLSRAFGDFQWKIYLHIHAKAVLGAVPVYLRQIDRSELLPDLFDAWTADRRHRFEDFAQFAWDALHKF